MSSLTGRIALVTGASRGIGRAVALALAKEGAHVVALARTVGALEELDDEIRAAGSSATLVPVDITDFEALDRLGGALYERWKKLDILVLNAAILGPVSPLGDIPPKTFSKLMDTNVTANWRLLRSMDKLLRASDAGRVIAVSSNVARSPRAYFAGYGTSKAALEMLVLTYADECKNTPIRTNILNPGAVRTKMRASYMPGEDPMTLPAPEDIAPLFVELAQPSLTANGELFDYPAWREAQTAS
jgi:NAD(P)-dependent dehydrogenase (short-subunit alcohol dehydrogenase family)